MPVIGVSHAIAAGLFTLGLNQKDSCKTRPYRWLGFRLSGFLTRSRRVYLHWGQTQRIAGCRGFPRDWGGRELHWG
ncbi:hypothetical protein [Coleofasciculus sp. G2-EDA-02]|uniref:hypothetical protein n=1 Tax=Coleofasciculus sp. G2-EDA-02 TaxID=3069529 RepID=UPI0032F9832B